jgi:hypothetical protein
MLFFDPVVELDHENFYNFDGGKRNSAFVFVVGFFCIFLYVSLPESMSFEDHKSCSLFYYPPSHYFLVNSATAILNSGFATIISV